MLLVSKLSMLCVASTLLISQLNFCPLLKNYTLEHHGKVASMAGFADTNFFEALENRVASSNSLLCVGLDPHKKELKEDSAFEALKFCKEIIDATHPYAACYKPNCAFFEAFGAAGISALIEVLRLIPGDIPVILDCKRGDIDSTAAAYAQSAYDIITPSSTSAVTLSPYMGWDSVKPFDNTNQ